MRIEGVAPARSFRRETRRGQSDEAVLRERFRFSADGYILDLSAEAIRHTGRGDARVARRVPAPPDLYNETGALAYYDPPVRPVILAPPAEPAAAEPAPPPMVSFVAFDGMLWSREYRRTVIQ